MSMIERVKEKARADRKTIVFPEGIEERTIQAATELVKEKLVDPVLLGKVEPEKLCKMPRYSLSFTVGVACEIDIVAGFGFLFYLFYERFLLLDVHIHRLEVMFDINSEL